MRNWMLIFCLFSFSAFAQDYPEHLQDMVAKSKEYFDIYGQKTPSEIEDGVYDESESTLFLQVDQINGLEIVFSKEEIRKIKTQMVKVIAESFDVAQLEAIIRVAKSPSINKKISARIFEVALEYKTGKILSTHINFILSPKLKSMR